VQQVVSHLLVMVLVLLLLMIHLQVLVQLLLKIHLQVLVQLLLKIHLLVQVHLMRQLLLLVHMKVLGQLLVLRQQLVEYILVLQMGHFNKDLGFLYKLARVSNFPTTMNYKLSLNTNILLHQSIIQLQFHSHNLNRTNTSYQL